MREERIESWGAVISGMLCDPGAWSGHSRVGPHHMMFVVMVSHLADLCHTHFHSAGDAAQQAVNGCW